ncbi:unnamed protein product, partial [Rotaria socialis]
VAPIATAMEVILKFKTPLRPAVDNVTPLITCIPQPPEQMSSEGAKPPRKVPAA